jgi:hypothetical protein
MLKKFLGKDKEIIKIKQTINIINQNNNVLLQNNNVDFEMIKSSIEILRSNVELLKSDKLDELELFDVVVGDIEKVDSDLKNMKKVLMNFSEKLGKYMKYQSNVKNQLNSEINLLKNENKILNAKFDIIFEILKDNTNIILKFEERKIKKSKIKIKKPFI